MRNNKLPDNTNSQLVHVRTKSTDSHSPHSIGTPISGVPVSEEAEESGEAGETERKEEGKGKDMVKGMEEGGERVSAAGGAGVEEKERESSRAKVEAETPTARQARLRETFCWFDVSA